MSHKYAKSRLLGGIDHFCCVQDFFFSIRVSYTCFFNKIYPSTKRLFKLLFQINKIKQTEFRFVVKLNEHVNIAVFRELFTQNGTEQRYLRDAPFSSNRLYFFLFNFDLW